MLKKMDMRFVIWNVRSLYRAGSLMAVAIGAQSASSPYML
jgi:hypothetical protein